MLVFHATVIFTLSLSASSPNISLYKARLRISKAPEFMDSRYPFALKPRETLNSNSSHTAESSLLLLQKMQISQTSLTMGDRSFIRSQASHTSLVLKVDKIH